MKEMEQRTCSHAVAELVRSLTLTFGSRPRMSSFWLFCLLQVAWEHKVVISFSSELPAKILSSHLIPAL